MEMNNTTIMDVVILRYDEKYGKFGTWLDALV